MLARASQYKESLKSIVMKSIDDPYYDYLWSNYTDFDMDVKDSNYYKQQWVSLENGCYVVGYLEAEIDRACNCVSSIVIANFCKNKNTTFALDLKEFFLRLFFRYNYHKVNFSVVVGSRNEKIYDKFISRYGGRIVGIFRNHKVLQDGSIRDMKYYEITKGHFKNALLREHPKLIKSLEGRYSQ